MDLSGTSVSYRRLGEPYIMLAEAQTLASWAALSKCTTATTPCTSYTYCLPCCMSSVCDMIMSVVTAFISPI